MDNKIVYIKLKKNESKITKGIISRFDDSYENKSPQPYYFSKGMGKVNMQKY